MLHRTSTSTSQRNIIGIHTKSCLHKFKESNDRSNDYGEKGID